MADERQESAAGEVFIRRGSSHKGVWDVTQHTSTDLTPDLPMYLVTLCMTMSAPQSRGFCIQAFSKRREFYTLASRNDSRLSRDAAEHSDESQRRIRTERLTWK